MKISGIVKKRSLDGTVIVTFGNNAYRKVIDNWITHIEALEIHNYVVIALDDELAKHLEQNGKPYYLAKCRPEKNIIYRHRVKLVSEILELGLGIIMSDADAVWLRDPRDDLINRSNADLVISQGMNFPPQVHNNWGFVMCFGLFYARPTHEARELFSKLNSTKRTKLDDQRELNLELQKRGIEWTIRDHTIVSLPKNKKMIGSNQRMAGRAEGVKVEILPYKQYQRKIIPKSEPYVAHPNSPKNQQGTIRTLKQHKLWRETTSNISKLIKKQRFWFVDVPRTSSSSIRAELSRSFGPVNGKRDYMKKDRKHAVRPLIPVHRTSLQMRDQLGHELWKNLFTFGFVRNPYARVWSMFCYWSMKRNQFRPQDFSKFIQTLGAGPKSKFLTKPASHFLTDHDGNLNVDQVFRFEEREDHLVEIGERIGMSFAGISTQAASKNKRPYTEYYDETIRRIVEDFYATDFELGGYSTELA